MEDGPFRHIHLTRSAKVMIPDELEYVFVKKKKVFTDTLESSAHDSSGHSVNTKID